MVDKSTETGGSPHAVNTGDECGGNEWNKVKHSLESIDGIQVDDPAAALEAACIRIEEQGWEPCPAGDGVGFSADGVRGTVWVRCTGVLASAETECMENDDGADG